MAASQPCFHCGEPIPKGSQLTITVSGADQPVCCAGCQAVARLIADAGLDNYYRYREGFAEVPDTNQTDCDWSAFDRDEARRDFVTDLGGNQKEACLLIEGLRCAACGWLIENALNKQPGIVSCQVNPASGRALVRWDNGTVALSQVLRRIAALGYRPQPEQADAADSLIIRERRAALTRLAVAGLGMMQVMMYATGLYAGAYQGIAAEHEQFLRLVSLLFATPVVFFAGAPFFRSAWRGLKARRPGMDVPVTLAIATAYGASVWSTLIGGGEVYFESVTMFIFFLTVARYLEMAARHRARFTTHSLVTLLPSTCLRLEKNRPQSVLCSELTVGDTVIVPRGAPIPADGTVLDETAYVDESILTGESSPQRKSIGDALLAGSLNAGETLHLKVARIGAETTVSHIVRLLQRAQAERPQIAVMADRIATYFVTGVLIAAGLVGLGWWQFAPERTFEVVLAVLVVTCPCALSLATPAALVAGTARLLSQGVLTLRTETLEILAKADRIVMDKTGTLTEGQIRIRRVMPLGGLTEQHALAIAAALESGNEHPVARAFAEIEIRPTVEKLRAHPSRGIEGEIEDKRWRIGTPDFVAELRNGEPLSPPCDADQAWIVLMDRTGNGAWFQLGDPIRPEAFETIHVLRALGLEIEIASGDRTATVAAVADKLGIERYAGGLSPDEKLNRLRQLQANGHRVITVGDGVNDAPFLSGADASVAMGSGSALTQKQADLVLLRNQLSTLTDTIVIARGLRRTIAQNLMWALAYNLVALPLAAAGLLAPWMAALGMSISSLVVVGNAQRLGRSSASIAPKAVSGMTPEIAGQIPG
ncbi:MAG: heavy metal translocating P-type ATPase [Pseudomonadota bacterium]|nr:heavy metal translocating P-type ATPase [Pseudomonadota bacterium]